MLNHKLAIKMKNTFKSLLFIFIINLTSTINAQIVDRDGGYVPYDVPAGTYIKDINNTFTKFLGTWKWQEGNKILTFKIEKVTQYYHTEYDVFEDFIIGNYSYTENGGSTYLVNTITQNIGVHNPELVPLFTSGTLNQNEINFTFHDIIFNKKSCDAVFKFLPNSINQMKLTLSNHFKGYILPDLPPNPEFSIPNNVVLTKQ
jgi:hypothetical protein